MYKVLFTVHFARQVKKYSKKDRKLKMTLFDLSKIFSEESSVSIGEGVYKMRLGKEHGGKSAGYRIYIFVREAWN